MIRFHPDENMLAEYSSGILDSALAITVKTHLQLCPVCRQKAANFDAIGATLLANSGVDTEDARGAEELEHSFSDLMKRIKSSQETRSVTKAKAREQRSDLPPMVSALIPKDSKLKWHRVTRFLKQANLSAGQEKYEVCLHKIERGGRVAKHDHRGLEVTVVLQGAFSDENGTYEKGDFIVREPGQKHRPQATLNQDCLCLTVVEAPVKLTGLFGALVNPFLPFHPA